MAERKTFLNIEYISDHSCGMYKTGEIDTSPDDAVAKHIEVYGEFGYEEIRDFAIRLLTKAREINMDRRLKESEKESVYGGV